jgi:hypothetical protein
MISLPRQIVRANLQRRVPETGSDTPNTPVRRLGTSLCSAQQRVLIIEAKEFGRRRPDCAPGASGMATSL